MNTFNNQGTSCPERITGTPNMKINSKSETVIAYVDGSHLGKNNKQGLPETLGFGIAINTDKGWCMCSHSQRSSVTIQYLANKYGIENLSNPTMEIAGTLKVLTHFANTAVNLIIRQDYSGAINYGGLWYFSEGSEHRAAKPWKTKEAYIKQIVRQAEIAANSIINAGGSIKIEWVKGHVGIEGNEKADEAAKDLRTYDNLPL